MIPCRCAYSTAEQIFASQPVNPGVNTLSFLVPIGTVSDITTFARFRFSQAGGITLSEAGGHPASATTARVEGGDSAYKEQGTRSDNDGLHLRDMSFLDAVDEFGDGIQLQILTVFPSLVLQQTHNTSSG